MGEGPRVEEATTHQATFPAIPKPFSPSLTGSDTVFFFWMTECSGVVHSVLLLASSLAMVAALVPIDSLIFFL